MEWAVFLAILRPAADVADGCLRLGEVDFAEVGVVGAAGSSLGFIWMIFLARLGGGGSSSLFFVLPDRVRLRWKTGDVGGDRFMAAGGRANALSMSTSLSWAVGPVEVVGVGGSFARGIVSSQYSQNSQRRLGILKAMTDKTIPLSRISMEKVV